MKLPFASAQLTPRSPPLPTLWPYVLWHTGNGSYPLAMNIVRACRVATVHGARRIGTIVMADMVPTTTGGWKPPEATSRHCYIRIHRGLYLPWTLTARRDPRPRGNPDI